MYFYLYDSFLQDKKFKKILNKIEARLTDLGIAGRIGRLNILRDASLMIEEAALKGAETIVAVGNDQTLSKIAGIVAKIGVILGFIPIEGNSALFRPSENSLSTLLGITSLEEACQTLSRRIIKRIDLGIINGHYFLVAATTKKAKVIIKNNGSYTITPLIKNSQIKVYNLGYLPLKEKELMSNWIQRTNLFNPQDGLLETVVFPSFPSFFSKIFKRVAEPCLSIIPLKKVQIEGLDKPVPVIVDGQRILKTPVSIEVFPQKLKIIVGKNRLF